MIPALSLSFNPARTARRNQVRRLFVRNRLSMGQIARRLHVSKPTVMRDLQWWRQQPAENASPDINAANLHREIEDMKEEAWCAYGRVVELKELEIDAARAGLPEDGRAATSRENSSGPSKSTRGQANSEWRYLSLIAKLIETQARLLGPAKPAGEAEAADETPSVVLYLPDNGRDRDECGSRNADCGMKEERGTWTANREIGTAGVVEDSSRNRRREEVEANVARLSSGCNGAAPTSSSDHVIAPSETLRTSASIVARHSNVEREVLSAQNSISECRATVPDSESADIELIRNVTVCNGVEHAQVAATQQQMPVLPETHILNHVTPGTNNNGSGPQPLLQQEAGVSVGVQASETV